MAESGTMADSAPQPQKPGNMAHSASTSESIRTSTFDPAALSNLLGLGDMLMKAGGTLDSAIQSMTQLATQRKTAEQQQAEAIAGTVQAQSDAGAAKAAYLAGEAARRKQILMAANMDPDQINNQLFAAMQTINEATPQLEQLGAEIDARQSVGIFDNPLEWIVNQVRLPGMVGGYNAVVRKQNRAVEQAKELQALSAAQMPLVAGIDADAIAKATLAETAANARQAQERLSAAQIAGNAAAVRDVAAEVQIAGAKFDYAARIAQLTKEVRTENVGVSEREIAKKEKEAIEAFELKSVNDYLKMIGSTLQYTPTTFKSIPPKEKQAYLERANTGKIAGSFAEAGAIIDERGSWQRISEGGDTTMVTWFRNTNAAALKDADAALKMAEQAARIGGKQVTEKQRMEMREEALNAYKARYESEVVDMSTASDNNPLKVQHAALATSKPMEGNAVAEYIKKNGPRSAQPTMPIVKDLALLDAFAANIVAGTATADSASTAISDYYKEGITFQRRMTKYTLFGMEQPNDYLIKVPKGGMFTRINDKRPDGVLDLTNKAAVSDYLTKATAAKILQKQMVPVDYGNISGVSP